MAETPPTRASQGLGLVPKVWYFFYFAALSTLFPYMNLYFRRLGMSEARIGLLAAFRPFVSFPAGSLWSGLADKLRAHRTVLLLLLAISFGTRLSLAAAGSFPAALALVLVTEFFAAAVTIIADAAVMAACTQEGEYGRQRLFGAVGWGICSALAGAAITHKGIYAAFACHGALALLTVLPSARLPFGALHAKLDAASGVVSNSSSEAESLRLDGGGRDLRRKDSGPSVELACRRRGSGQVVAVANELGGKERPRRRQQQHQPHQLQHSREPLRASDTNAGAARGGAAAAVPPEPSCSGAEVASGIEDLESEPLLHSAESGVAPGISGSGDGRSQLGAAGEAAREDAGGTAGAACTQQGQQPKVQFWQGVRQLLASPHVLVFLGMVFTMGFGVGNIESYLFLYLDGLGAPETLMGLSLSVTCAAEVVVFWYSGALIQRLGIRRCTHLVFAAFLLRLLCYATLAHWGSPWMVLPVELLHGFTFALAWGTGTAFASKMSPAGLEATTQAAFQGVYFGVGYGVGGLVGGAVYERHGAQLVYWVAFAVMLAGWAMGGAAELLLSVCAPSGVHGRSYAPVEVLDVELAAEPAEHKMVDMGLDPTP